MPALANCNGLFASDDSSCGHGKFNREIPMLVLSRKLEAPDDVSVLRDELLKRPPSRKITRPEEDLRDKPDCWNSPDTINRWEVSELMGMVQ